MRCREAALVSPVPEVAWLSIGIFVVVLFVLLFVVVATVASSDVHPRCCVQWSLSASCVYMSTNCTGVALDIFYGLLVRQGLGEAAIINHCEYALRP